MSLIEQSTLDEQDHAIALAEADAQIERDVEHIEKDLIEHEIPRGRILEILASLKNDTVSSIPDERFTIYRTVHGFGITWHDHELAA